MFSNEGEHERIRIVESSLGLIDWKLIVDLKLRISS